MSAEKVWLGIPFIRRTFSIIYMVFAVILVFTSIADYRTQNIGIGFYFNVLIIILLIIDFINSRAKIITSEEKIEVITPLKHKSVYWHKVSDYRISPTIITLYIDANAVEIAIKYLQQKELFIEMVKNKLTVGLETECLNCGDKIAGHQDKCPSCNWSWKD